MSQPIRGKVARVLNEREIAINVGTAKGVAVGMYFDVMHAEVEDIIDPDTDEVLESIERPKVRVEIIHAQEKLSVATTFQTERVNVGGYLGPFARSLMPPKWIEKHETLRVQDKGWSPLHEKDSYVKIGDCVVQVIEENEREKQALTTETQDLGVSFEGT